MSMLLKVSFSETGEKIEEYVEVENTPTIDIEFLAKDAKAERDRLLLNTDWYVIRYMEAGILMPAEVSTYRQALRDIPEQEGFPTVIAWPVKPV